MKFLQKLFTPDEFINNKALSLIYLVLLFDLIITFNDWFYQKYLTIQSVKTNSVVCWPHFQNCLDFYVFNAYPQGFSLPILYLILGSFLFASAYFAYINDWAKALLFLTVPVIFKFLMLYLFTYEAIGNYNTLGVLLALFIIFAKDKLFSLKILLTTFYLCAVVIKLNSGYLSGAVFSSLNIGVPLIPSFLLPYSGIVLISLFVVSPLFLWSKNNDYRLYALVSLTLFHLYSITLVGFRFPLLCIPLLWLVFHFSRYKRFEFNKLIKSKFTLLVVGIVVLMQSIPFLISGDERLTSEGEKYGFYMYTANRQCVREINISFVDGMIDNNKYEERRGMRRCDPYEDWYVIQRECKKENVKNIEWIFNVSINGSYFYTLVDTKEACDLPHYKAFEHNDWLKLNKLDKTIPVLKNSL